MFIQWFDDLKQYNGSAMSRMYDSFPKPKRFRKAVLTAPPGTERLQSNEILA